MRSNLFTFCFAVWSHWVTQGGIELLPLKPRLAFNLLSSFFSLPAIWVLCRQSWQWGHYFIDNQTVQKSLIFWEFLGNPHIASDCWGRGRRRAQAELPARAEQCQPEAVCPTLRPHWITRKRWSWALSVFSSKGSCVLLVTTVCKFPFVLHAWEQEEAAFKDESTFGRAWVFAKREASVLSLQGWHQGSRAVRVGGLAVSWDEQVLSLLIVLHNMSAWRS